MYLWRRKLGTPEYPSGFFVRYFDEKIAALINYREARANYAMMNQVPERLRAHADRLAANTEAEQQKLGAFEQEIASSRLEGSRCEKRAVEARAALDAERGRGRGGRPKAGDA